MNISQIVLSYLKLLVWPGLVAIVVFRFRSTIKHLMEDKLTRIEAGGISAQFERAASEAVSTVASEGSEEASVEKVVDVGKVQHFHAGSYLDARRFGDIYRSGDPVIVELQDVQNGDDSTRLVDFMAGMTFMARGSIERITNKVFLLIPPDRHVRQWRSPLADDIQDGHY